MKSSDNRPDASPAIDIKALADLPHGSDQLLRILVQGVTDYAILLLDPQGSITTWNTGAERINGYRADEIIGSNFSRFYPAEDQAAGLPRQALQTAIETGRFEQEAWRVRKDGKRFWAQVVIDAVRNNEGQLIAFATVMRDLTERFGARAALRESEERFRMLVQGVTDYAIYMLDPEGCVTNWNLGGERIKGYSASDIVGQHFSLFYTEEDRVRGEPGRTLGTASREGRFEGEGWRLRKDGSRFWASVVVDRILDNNGKLVGFAKITRDMSEKKAAAEELEKARAALAQSQKMEAIGQLTGGVAHDFNNLLTVVANSLDLLADQRRDEAARRRIIEFAQRATERGARLTQQLLAYSRRQPLRPEIHDINRLIRGFEAVLRRACQEAIDFSLPLAPGSLAANIDGPQFETALLNLAVNARDAMPTGGRLTIATDRATIDQRRAVLMSNLEPGDYIKITVTDTGEGMSPEVVGRAFEPFFTTKEIGKGSGLGLSQVYGFVAQSGGHVDIASAPGEGTSITIYLPAAAGAAAGEAEIAQSAQAGPSIGRVLVVEDDPEVLDVTVETLRRIGYEVLTASDAPTALAVLHREAEIDILFSDIVMPRGMNGVELARTALKLRPQLRVLLASGYPMSALSGTRPGTEGGFAFLSKPYRGAELAEALRALQSP